MNILCASTGLIWVKKPQKGISGIKEGGFEEILLDMSSCCPPGELEYLGKEIKGSTNILKRKPREESKIFEHPEELAGRFRLLLEQCREQGIAAPIARAPYLHRTTRREDLGDLLLRLAEESIKVCGQAGCRYLVVSPLFSGIERGLEWEANRGYYLRLADVAKQEGVMILLENQCREMNGSMVRGICSDAREAATWIDGLNAVCGEERFGLCMDVGICSLCGQDMREYAAALGSRIKAVILRDCDGVQEGAMLPFTCMIGGKFCTDWLSLIRGLREICFDGLLVMDFSSMTAAYPQSLRPQLLQSAWNMAAFFQWQIGMKSVLKKYDKRVLFGAGNMCRNFMKCYGEEFPPLFTCDNDSTRWGERFAGLEIRPPEALKDLAPDCAIFICNIYYTEIEQQLRKMGVTNPIERFNDEYMPSYYHDRLEYWEGEG